MRKLLSLVILAISGCSTLSPSFVTTVQDQRVLTDETNAAIINTLQYECQAETDPVVASACDDLVERLNVISRQAVAIEKYVRNKLTEEELAKYLRTKWRTNP